MAGCAPAPLPQIIGTINLSVRSRDRIPAGCRSSPGKRRVVEPAGRRTASAELQRTQRPGVPGHYRSMSRRGERLPTPDQAAAEKGFLGFLKAPGSVRRRRRGRQRPVGGVNRCQRRAIDLATGTQARRITFSTAAVPPGRPIRCWSPARSVPVSLRRAARDRRSPAGAHRPAARFACTTWFHAEGGEGEFPP